MKKKFLIRKLIFYSVFLLFLWLPYSNYAQAVKRQCISSYGSIVLLNDLLAGQTAGQSYFTIAFDNNKTAVLQGFQQPVAFTYNNIITVPPGNTDFKISPNPASYSFSIQSEEVINNVSVLVSDINGRNIMSEKIPQLSEHEIICESWEAGIYFITIYINNQNKQTQRIIILK